jgi:hypothetical protein
MEDKNPLENVRFYTKERLNEPIKLDKNQVKTFKSMYMLIMSKFNENKIYFALLSGKMS